jgi:hypothetical protein
VKTPYLRMSVGLIILVIVFESVIRRKSSNIVAHEQDPPTGFASLDALFGETTQTFVRTLDTSTLVLLLGGIANTIMRPYECAFIQLPCGVPECVFKASQDREMTRRLGNRRRHKLAMQLHLAKSRTKVGVEKRRASIDKTLSRLEQKIADSSVSSTRRA